MGLVRPIRVLKNNSVVRFYIWRDLLAVRQLKVVYILIFRVKVLNSGWLYVENKHCKIMILEISLVKFRNFEIHLLN